MLNFNKKYLYLSLKKYILPISNNLYGKIIRRRKSMSLLHLCKDYQIRIIVKFTKNSCYIKIKMLYFFNYLKNINTFAIKFSSFCFILKIRQFLYMCVWQLTSIFFHNANFAQNFSSEHSIAFLHFFVHCGPKILKWVHIGTLSKLCKCLMLFSLKNLVLVKSAGLYYT